MSSIMHEWVTVQASDGTSMEVYVARPADDHNKHAAVLVFQEIWGVNSHIREVCDRFARLGYTAAAPDIFHRSVERFDAPYSDFSGREHAMKLNAEGVSADLSATHAMLREMLEASTNTPRIAACGFCMGGRLAFIANALLPLDAAISFYGGGIAGQLAFAPQQHGPLMLFWAGKDGFISKDDRRNTADALEAAGKRFTEVNVSHADHGFFCDQRKSYDAEAANEAWGMVTAFLASNLSEK